MNFREGVKANGEEICFSFENLSIFEKIGFVRCLVGANLHHLRMLSLIRKAGYFNRPNFMGKLISVNKKEKWKL